MRRSLALCLALAVCACSRGTSPEDELPLEAGFDETMEALRVEHGLSALAVGVIRDGQLVRAGAYGIADRRTYTPAKVDSLFGLASVSKVLSGSPSPGRSSSARRSISTPTSTSGCAGRSRRGTPTSPTRPSR